jgi:hypothetical protein
VLNTAVVQAVALPLVRMVLLAVLQYTEQAVVVEAVVGMWELLQVGLVGMLINL